MDCCCQASGAFLDELGLGPRQSPSRVLYEEPGLRLHFHGGGHAGGPVLLMAPAPVKAHWIWDLEPDCSVVRAALRRGCQVWLLEWTLAPVGWELEEYVAAIAGMPRAGALLHRPTATPAGALAGRHPGHAVRSAPSRHARVIVDGAAADRIEHAHRVLPYRGDGGVLGTHLGALIGDSAHRSIWPHVFAWLHAIDWLRRQ